MPSLKGARLPDLYDPDEPLSHPTPLPIYHIAGKGGFVAKAGRVYLPSRGLEHREKSHARDVVRDALASGARVTRVIPGGTEWEAVEAPPTGSAKLLDAAHARKRAPWSREFPDGSR